MKPNEILDLNTSSDRSLSEIGSMILQLLKDIQLALPMAMQCNKLCALETCYKIACSHFGQTYTVAVIKSGASTGPNTCILGPITYYTGDHNIIDLSVYPSYRPSPNKPSPLKKLHFYTFSYDVR